MMLNVEAFEVPKGYTPTKDSRLFTTIDLEAPSLQAVILLLRLWIRTGHCCMRRWSSCCWRPAHGWQTRSAFLA